MKVWITKYALSSGIECHSNARIWKERVVQVFETKYMNGSCLFHNNEWWESRSEAITQAEVMRDKKIASLKKQIAKLEAMDFEKSTPK